MIIEAGEQPKERKRNAPEANIQAQCFTWFWNAYPQYRKLLFCVSNENSRSKYESKKMREISGARRKLMGVVAGVSDLVGLIPNKKYHGLCAECKTKYGTQEGVQKEWQRIVESHGYYYFVFRTLEQFQEEIRKYLKEIQI